MVMKPAKQTPLSMLALAQILEEAGLPGGVVNIVTSLVAGAVIGAADRATRARASFASPVRPRSGAS